MDNFKPEMAIWKIKDSLSTDEIAKAMSNNTIIEGKVLKCDKELNLHIKLADNVIGIVPFEESEYNVVTKAPRTASVTTKVGKTIKFIITEKKDDNTYICSRKAAQKKCYTEFISKLKPGDIIQARATHIEDYGVFCDIGCGITALLPIRNFSTNRISNAKENLKTLTDLYVVVKSIEKDGKIELSHKELLGTWEENAAKLSEGDLVPGVVRDVTEYGTFIEIGQNITGLADNKDKVNVGDPVVVAVTFIDRDRCKVKLNIISSEQKDDNYTPKVKYNYVKRSGHIDEWSYYPENINKRVVTRF